MRLEWPFTLAECIETEPRTGCTRLTAQFEEFVKVPSNWVFDRAILKTFPELEGRVAFYDEN
jgi:hypothetical protein